MDIITIIKIVRKIKEFVQKFYNNESFLSQVEFHVVDHCNLNCKYCDHFTPLAPEKFMTVKEVMKDFRKLKRIYKKIGKIYILGGEPLLHPNLTDFFAPLAKLYPESELIIITNGILLNQQSDNFWEQVKKYKVSISMTKYPIKVDYENLLNFMNEQNIKSYIFCGERTYMYNSDLDYKGRYNSDKSYEICSRKYCHFLSNGKLYQCTLVPNIRFLNKYFNLNFPVSKNDYIDLDKVKSASKADKYLSNKIPFCKYCPDYCPEQKKHEISKKQLDEWVKTETIQ